MKPWFLCVGIALLALGCGSTGEVLQDFDGDGSLDANDCGPAEATIYPGAADAYGDGVDSNCDGLDGIDSDGDGYPGNEELLNDIVNNRDIYDCADNDPTVHPGAVEIPFNGIDENCDGFDDSDTDGDGDPDSADCDDNDPDINHFDDDSDGYSPCDGDCDDDDASLSPLDADGDQVSLCEGDCDDSDSSIYPDAEELCDQKDNDCDGELFLGELDLDLDGYGICEGDCDDNSIFLHPGDTDGDGDTLCDPVPDCDDDNPTLNQHDVDSDGYTTCNGDCDDTSFTTRPGADELCDAIDNDCDAALPADEIDADGDGDLACADCNDTDPGITGLDEDGDGSNPCDGDCDESNSNIHPAQTDYCCDGVDQNCDGTDGIDADLDGYGSETTGGPDCNDEDSTIFPTATELCDGIDQDCDTFIDEDFDTDVDGSFAATDPGCITTYSSTDCNDSDPALNSNDIDTDGLTSCDGDCDDHSTDTLPGAPELCDGVDNNCDSSLPIDEIDVDGDGDLACADCDDGDPGITGIDADFDFFTPCTGDCNEANNSIFPGAIDAFGDGFDTNCDGVDGTDADGDGYAVDASTPDCDDSDPTLNLFDGDGDGFHSCNNECDDNDPTRYPGSPALGPGFARYGGFDTPGDGIDEDCDGTDVSGLVFADAIFIGEGTGQQSGAAVSSAGDFDGDGLSDLLIGAPFAQTVLYQSPRAYLVLGGTVTPQLAADPTTNTWDLSQVDGVVLGSYEMGRSVSWAGDVNGDGLSDFLLGGSGGARLFTGDVLPPGSTTLTEWLHLNSTGESDDNCCWVAGGGDVDGDGISDLAIGDSHISPKGPLGNNLTGLTQAGRTHLLVSSGVMSHWGGLYGQISTSGLSEIWEDFSGEAGYGVADVVIHGGSPLARSGRRVTFAGDVDGDGLDDLLISADALTSDGLLPEGPYLFLGSTLSESEPFWGQSGGGSNSTYTLAADVDVTESGTGDDDDDDTGGDDDDFAGCGDDDDGSPSEPDCDGDGDPDSSDCNSENPFVHHAATETCNGIDDNCDGSTDEGFDNDGDGFNFCGGGTDCNDADPAINPDALEICGNGLDDDCDFTTVCYQGTPDLAFVAESADFRPASFAAAGDVDGDGLDDLLFGPSASLLPGGLGLLDQGTYYLILGSTLAAHMAIAPTGSGFNLSLADATFAGDPAGGACNSFEFCSGSIASAGDVDGDGLDDLLIGYPQFLSNSSAGRTYLFLGSTVAAGGHFELTAADAVFDGLNTGLEGLSGSAVSSAGDVNGDGLDDLLIGAQGAAAVAGFPDQEGRTYLILSPFARPEYAGRWTLSPPITYTCGSGYLSAELELLVTDHRAPYANVSARPELTMHSHTAQPGLLAGGFVATDTFELERIEDLGDPEFIEAIEADDDDSAGDDDDTSSTYAGPCSATWTLSGAYTGPDSLTADFGVTFTGGCEDCVNQNWTVTATR